MGFYKFRQSLRFRTITVNISRGMHSNIPASKMLNITDNRKIAYRQSTGSNSPGIIFLPGFMSNMKGTKSSLLNDFCVTHGHSFLCFDYESIGESPGNFRDIHLGKWKEDVLAAFDQLTTGPQIRDNSTGAQCISVSVEWYFLPRKRWPTHPSIGLKTLAWRFQSKVGSSMGAWLMFLVAQECKERIHSLCSISAAVNFTDRFYSSFPKKIRDKIDCSEEVIIPGPYGNYPITKTFLDEARKLFLPMDSPIPLCCPVRLMHSIQDEAAPYETSILLSKLLESKDVEVILRKDADHRMSDPESLAMTVNILKDLLRKNDST